MRCSDLFTGSVVLVCAALVTASPAAPLAIRSTTPAATGPSSSEFITLGCPKTTVPVADEALQFTTAKTFSQMLFVDKKISEAFSCFIARDLINHAPDVPGDGAALAQATIAPRLSSANIEIQYVTVGQDRMMTYFKATSPVGVLAAVDIFRMSGTCMVEHWVVTQPVANSSNPHPFF